MHRYIHMCASGSFKSTTGSQKIKKQELIDFVKTGED